MNRAYIIEITQEIFRDIFDDQTLVIYEDMSPDNIATWDSLRHINLLIAIQNEFKIKFDLTDLYYLKNVKTIVDLLMKKNITDKKGQV